MNRNKTHVFGLNFEDKLKLILVHDPSIIAFIEVF